MRRALAFVLLAACYEPEAVDCTVECAGAADCADGQVCGSDGLCASPAMAGKCHSNANDEPPAAVSLVVTISGHGKVTIEKVGMCDSETAPDGTCTFTVAPNVMRQLKAVEAKDREFIAWTSTCAGSSTTCTVTPITATTNVGAKFE